MNEKISRSEELLHRAAAELRWLRQENQLLGAQVGVIEVFRAALLGRPSQGMSPDLAWEIDRFLRPDPSDAKQVESA